ncbi:unnamed protein product, partial [Ceratitis capitata]
MFLTTNMKIFHKIVFHFFFRLPIRVVLDRTVVFSALKFYISHLPRLFRALPETNRLRSAGLLLVIRVAVKSS